MDGTPPDRVIALPLPVLDRLMQMHVCVDADGVIEAAGPTLRKVTGGDPAGRPFFELFHVRRPAGVGDIGTLRATGGNRLRLALNDPPGTAFRGFALPAGDRGRVIVKLSFGLTLADAVRDHALTDADFAPTDHAVELLFLLEAKALVTGELGRLTDRLQGARDAAQRQALTDTLTGLMNRRGLDLALAALLAARRPFGLMHLDLDWFKAVNDTLGHAAGDHVLAEVARILRMTARAGDTMARIGGDEFVVVLPDMVDPEILARVAERIIGRLNEPIPFGGRECRISGSIGVAVSTACADLSAERMLAEADRALYASKRAGRGRASFA